MDVVPLPAPQFLGHYFLKAVHQQFDGIRAAQRVLDSESQASRCRPPHPLPMMATKISRGGTLLPWDVISEELVAPADGGPCPAAKSPDSGGGPGTAAGLPALSLVDRLAAPTAWMHLALVFAQPLDGDQLRDALAQALTLFPTLACRANQDVVRCCSFAQACTTPHDGTPI